MIYPQILIDAANKAMRTLNKRDLRDAAKQHEDKLHWKGKDEFTDYWQQLDADISEQESLMDYPYK